MNIVVDLVTCFLVEYGLRLSPILFTRGELLEEAESSSPLLQTLLLGYEILYDPKGVVADALEKVYERRDLTYVERGGGGF